ncbi:hypothetical protein EI427_15350 [Flammeovirga pectinis]|uniref:Uncharacterized protein n=1 Tax=Flammeovirga pectinis TaxID=2494373 RepID=A0A3Q9FS92_9BACT|nr:hypothetical protein [Flammeovirga pectinis]AZQ63547.1 hypothetical protein EI427_15350 [Flammeovirga pectinis]
MSDKKPSFFEGFKAPVDMLNKLRTVFYTLASFSVPFSFLWYIQYKGEAIDPIMAPLGNTIVGLVAGICILIAAFAYYQYQQKLKLIRTEVSLPYRLSMLLKAQCVKFVPLCFPPVITIVLFRLTLEPLMFGTYLLTMILFAMSNPSVHTTVSDLRLNKRDKEVMLQNTPFEEIDMKL